MKTKIKEFFYQWIEFIPLVIMIIIFALMGFILKINGMLPEGIFK
jgi:hypothetical protein